MGEENPCDPWERILELEPGNPLANSHRWHVHELTGGLRAGTLLTGFDREPRISSSSLESLSSNLSSLFPKSKSSPGEFGRTAFLGGGEGSFECSTSSKSQTLEDFAACCGGVEVAGAGVSLDPKSDNPQSSSSSAITGGVLVDGGGGAGLKEVEAGVSNIQSKSSCFCGGGVEVDVVPRESNPLQADDCVFVAVCWLRSNNLSFLSFSTFAACSAMDKFPELAGPFPKESDKSPLNASPFEDGVGFGPFD